MYTTTRIDVTREIFAARGKSGAIRDYLDKQY
jgi:hypothetical protein